MSPSVSMEDSHWRLGSQYGTWINDMITTDWDWVLTSTSHESTDFQTSLLWCFQTFKVIRLASSYCPLTETTELDFQGSFTNLSSCYLHSSDLSANWPFWCHHQASWVLCSIGAQSFKSYNWQDNSHNLCGEGRFITPVHPHDTKVRSVGDAFVPREALGCIKQCPVGSGWYFIL